MSGEEDDGPYSIDAHAVAAENRARVKVICILPLLETPWELKAFGGGVLCVNAGHPPLFIKDGKVEELSPK